MILLSGKSFRYDSQLDFEDSCTEILKDLNVNPEARTASGRITIVREPSPLILSALHLTMNQNFNMDEIFGHLVDEKRSNVQST